MCRCIKSLESSLLISDNPETAEYFKLVVPPSTSPSWMSFKRRPHAYEEIMGASQEELDWDESDLGGTTPTSSDKESFVSCDMVKVEDSSPSRLREPRVRVVHHQYEEVELGKERGGGGGAGGGAGEQDQVTLKESWVEEEGVGLPKGWQHMRDEHQREYYWHIPTGRTQYSPPSATPSKKV